MWERIKTKIKETTTKTKVLIVIVALIAASLIKGWYTKVEHSTSTYTEVPQSSSVSSVPQEVVSAKVKVYDKAKAAKKIPALPASVVEDPKKALISSVDTPKTKAGFNVVTTIDTTTGTVTSYTKEKELPLFGLENEKRIGIGYGLSTKADQVIRVYGEYGFARVGSIYASVRAEGDLLSGASGADIEGKALINLEYRP